MLDIQGAGDSDLVTPPTGFCGVLHIIIFTAFSQASKGKEKHKFITGIYKYILMNFHKFIQKSGARCSSVVRVFAHGAMGCRINPSWGGPIELFLIPASSP